MAAVATDGAVRANVVLQHVSAQTGGVTRTKSFKMVELTVAVDDARVKSLVACTRPKQTVLAEGRALAGASIKAKFAREGKVTIALPAVNMFIFVSNANPARLPDWIDELARFLGVAPPAHASRDERGACAALGATQQPNSLAGRRARDDPRASCGQIEPSTKRARTTDDAGPDAPALNAEQVAIVQLVRDGHSLFFTGAAGTGKSRVLGAVIGEMPAESTAVTAMTTSAAALIGGTTLHAFAGIGSDDRPLSELIASAGSRARDTWRRTKLLIIDEVSMLSAELFDKLDAVARVMRGSDAPFGGLQLLLCGDFFQLPPVLKRGAAGALFAFQARAWQGCGLKAVQLTTVHRQADAELVRLLHDVRVGSLSARSLALLQRCERTDLEATCPPGVVPTRLFTHRADCDAVNAHELGALAGATHRFAARDSGTGARGRTPSQLLSAAAIAPEQLELKVGAQVLLLRTVSAPDGLVKGTRGRVARFAPGSGLPVVAFANGVEHTIERQPFLHVVERRVAACRSQLPLALGWAISVHKSQGMTLDCVEVSLGRAFEFGQTYVALSRCRALGGLRVRDFDATAVRAHPDVLDFYEAMFGTAR